MLLHQSINTQLAYYHTTAHKSIDEAHEKKEHLDFTKCPSLVAYSC